MGIIGATDLVAMSTEAAHVKSVADYKIYWSALPIDAAKNYVDEHSAWWCRILASWGFDDKLLAAHARVAEGGD